jgi:hypothetical protein
MTKDLFIFVPSQLTYCDHTSNVIVPTEKGPSDEWLTRWKDSHSHSKNDHSSLTVKGYT